MSRLKDNGCEFASSCLECPLQDCKHAMRSWERRDIQIIRLYDLGTSVQALAERFNVTEHTVYRVLSRRREYYLKQEARHVN